MEDTIFGKFTRGEIPTEFLYEDEQCVVIRDIHPQAPTHVLGVGQVHEMHTKSLWTKLWWVWWEVHKIYIKSWRCTRNMHEIPVAGVGDAYKIHSESRGRV